MTHTSENITLPQTSFAGGNNIMNIVWLPASYGDNLGIIVDRLFHVITLRVNAIT